MALVGSAFLVDGGAISWTLKDDTYTVRSAAPLSAGEHTLGIAAGAPFDLAGKGLEEPFESPISVEDGTDNTDIYSRPDPRSVAINSLVNRFTFHGRPVDVETGLYYFRNRYLDPELGRFVTTDPLGFQDGPSQYQFAGYSPFNFGDPYGLLLTTGRIELEAIKRILTYSRHPYAPYLASTLELPPGDEYGEVEIKQDLLVWAQAAMADPVIWLLFRAIHDPLLDINLEFVTADSSLEKYCGGSGHTEFRDGKWRSDITLDAALFNSGRVRYPGIGNVWIEAFLLTTIVHELGHPVGLRMLGYESDFRLEGQEGPTAQYATDREDEFRRLVGAPLRGTHTRGLILDDWANPSEDSKMKMFCVEKGIDSWTKDCRWAWEGRNKAFEKYTGRPAPPYEPRVSEFTLPPPPRLRVWYWGGRHYTVFSGIIRP